MPWLAILYIIFDMAIHVLTKRTYTTKRMNSVVASALNWAVLSILLRLHTFLKKKKVDFILSLGCNNEKKLKVTLKFTLTKLASNWSQL